MRKLPLRLRPRLLPVTIFAVAMLLAVRAGVVWTGAEPSLGRILALTEPAAGQQDAAAEPAEDPDDQMDATAEPAPETPTPSQEAAPAEAEGSAARRASSRRDPSDFSDSEIEVLQDLAARREALDKREADMRLREGLLQAAEKRVAEKVAELKRLQAMVTALIEKHEKVEEAKIESLAKIYGAMKPKDAARIFAELDLPILLALLQRMKESKIAPILAALDPKKAQEITAELAARRQDLGALPQPEG